MVVAYFKLRRNSLFLLHDLYLSSRISSGYPIVLIKLTVIFALFITRFLRSGSVRPGYADAAQPLMTAREELQ